MLRERHGDGAFLLGFLTHAGTVVAANEWDGPGRVRALRPALAQSDAGLLHAAGTADGFLFMRGATAADPRFQAPRQQRAASRSKCEILPRLVAEYASLLVNDAAVNQSEKASR